MKSAKNDRSAMILIHCDNKASAACAKETKKYLDIIECGHNFVIAKGNREQVTKALWHTQTALDMLYILQENVTSQTINQELWPEITKDLIHESFAVRSIAPNSLDVNKEWGAALKDITNLAVHLTNPKTLFVPFLKETLDEKKATHKEMLLCLSLTNKELRKREYKIFTSNTSLRSTVAAAALHFANYTGSEKILIPYESDGTLAIEAAYLATNKSPYTYAGGPILSQIKEDENTTNEEAKQKKSTQYEDEDDFDEKIVVDVATPTVQYLKAIQKNAKIAGILDTLNLTKAEPDWLDTKFDEKTFDLIVAHLPSSGKKRTEKESAKTAAEIAYQAAYLLKKKGTITILSQKISEHEDAFKQFTKKEQHDLFMGEQAITLITFVKEK